MKQLKSVVPILIASTIQLSFLFPLLDSVPYVSSPAAKAILYSPDTKVPRTGEVALRRAIPANSNMKAIQVTTANTYVTPTPSDKRQHLYPHYVIKFNLLFFLNYDRCRRVSPG